MANISGNETFNNSYIFSDYIQNSRPQGSEAQEKYILPLFLLVGTFSNVSTLVIFCRGKQTRISVSIYVSAYCIGNLTTLFFLYGMHLLTTVSAFPELSNLNSSVCSILAFIHKMVQYSSVWFVVGMTIDRYIAVCHPSSALTMCTVFMAKVAVGIILIGLVVTSVHAMWVYDINHKTGICDMFTPENNLQIVHLKIWNILSAAAYVYLPLIILLILNTLLTCGLCFQHSSSSTSTQDNGSTEYTNAVVAISMLYFALVLPVTLHNIVMISSGLQMTTDMYNTLVIFDHMQRINLVNVFFVCLLFSRSFRQELHNIYRLIREKRKQTVEMSRLSNKALITNETTTTTVNEEDTLI
ncbi:Hypothetical predicted protein [Mytilus galloprovincialis]|uniref:G-protein coupled receptors family 1 profile domain-containing protein n=1 Tax=Mytilus galloprovincialis TaxID=29158 RepID=A0A8B6FWW5_MYTGA|nr:Hypothetical predicted protein [Mytilus galloprovincialis]